MEKKVLLERIVPGVLLALFWILLLVYGSEMLFDLVILVITAVAAWEYSRMVYRDYPLAGAARWLRSCFCIGCTLLPAALLTVFSRFGVAGDILLMLATLMAAFLLACRHIACFKKNGFSEVDGYQLLCRDIVGLLYVGVLSSYFILLRSQPQGEIWLLIATAITAGSDSGAYFVGRAFGRQSLCVAVSPKKTIEGAVGGMVVAVILAVSLGFILLDTQPAFSFLFFSALFLTVFGILGDLTESIIKRGTATKDSGTLLAGHGGILDRIDSLLFVVPALYYFLILYDCFFIYQSHL